jgi:hypothetical protein
MTSVLQRFLPVTNAGLRVRQQHEFGDLSTAIQRFQHCQSSSCVSELT